MAPFFDPESSPALDALRRDCLEELQHNFPLSKDARTCAVVLVCGDMRVESADWLALVLAVDRLERDGVLFVKPLETAEDERSLSEPFRREEPFDSSREPLPAEKPVATPRAARAANPRGPTRLRVAVSAPAQTLPAAAVMDCLRFENKPPPGQGLGSGATGAARRRSAVPPADADREALRAEYVFSPGPELRNRLLRKHSGGSDGFDGFDGTSPRRVEDEDDDEDDDENEDENEVEVDDEVEVEAAAAAATSASASASASAASADGAARRVFDTSIQKVFGDGSPDAVTTFEGTSRQTRRRRKRPRSGSAAPAPVALRRQTKCPQKSGSEALRDALAAASVSGAMTLHVPVGVVAATLAELDELRARLDRAETRA